MAQALPAEQLLRQRRAGDPLGPHPAPPLTGLRRGEAPRAGGRVDLRQSRGVRPGQQVTAGVGLPAVRSCCRLVELQPPVEAGQPGIPRERRVVAVAHGHHSPGPGHPRHLAQCGHRVRHVLQHLVGVGHVDVVVGQVERMDVTDSHLGVRDALTLELGPSQRGSLLGGLDRHDLAHQSREIGGDRARPGAHVEQPVGRPQPRQQVRRAVGGRAGPVRPEHALGVAVGVGHRRDASVVQPDAGRGLRDQVLEPEAEDLTERHQRGQARVQGRPGP